MDDSIIALTIYDKTTKTGIHLQNNELTLCQELHQVRITPQMVNITLSTLIREKKVQKKWMYSKDLI